jgi:hypothetical protein
MCSYSRKAILKNVIAVMVCYIKVTNILSTSNIFFNYMRHLNFLRIHEHFIEEYLCRFMYTQETGNNTLQKCFD